MASVKRMSDKEKDEADKLAEIEGYHFNVQTYLRKAGTVYAQAFYPNPLTKCR